MIKSLYIRGYLLLPLTNSTEVKRRYQGRCPDSFCKQATPDTTHIPPFDILISRLTSPTTPLLILTAPSPDTISALLPTQSSTPACYNNAKFEEVMCKPLKLVVKKDYCLSLHDWTFVAKMKDGIQLPFCLQMELPLIYASILLRLQKFKLKPMPRYAGLSPPSKTTNIPSVTQPVSLGN
jgi:hypothetical protein